MTSSNEPPGGPAGPRGRRPPTIDLKATEVGGESAKATPKPEDAAASPSVSERLRAWLPADFASFPWPVAAACAGGVVLTLLVLALAGVFSGRDEGLVAVDTRLARVENQLSDAAVKPSRVAGDSKAVDELAGRVARLETVIATPRPPVTDSALANRIATLEGDLKALGERVGVLGRRNDDIATIAGEARTRADAAAAAVAELKKAPAAAEPVVERADIEALTSRIAALERAAKAMEAQLAGRTNQGNTDRSLRVVVVASALNAAVERGAPFGAELGGAKIVAPDPKALAALEPFAASGVPSATALTRELTALVPALAKAVGTSSRDSGILGRLKANAERLVRVRPIDEVTGDDPTAVVRRIELRAEQGNLNGAMAEIAKLPAPAQALTKEWVAKVEARDAAVETSRRFAAAALASLAKPSL